MPDLIKDGVIATDPWRLIDNPDPAAPIPAGKVIVPLSVWQDRREDLRQRDSLGVWLDIEESAEQLGEDAGGFHLIAVNFPAFMDGRGFSTGRLLRERYGFTGELRAIGHFIRDQLCYLKRCGYNAFRFSEPTDLDAALKSLDDFTEYYQSGTDQPLPLFRRRG